METKIIKVTDKGQISLPIQFRKSLDIEQGDELFALETSNAIVLKKVNEDDFSDLIKLNEKSLKKIWDNSEDDIWDSYLRDEN